MGPSSFNPEECRWIAMKTKDRVAGEKVDANPLLFKADNQWDIEADKRGLKKNHEELSFLKNKKEI